METLYRSRRGTAAAAKLLIEPNICQPFYQLDHDRKLHQNIGTQLNAQQAVLVHQHCWPCHQYVRRVTADRVRTRPAFVRPVPQEW